MSGLTKRDACRKKIDLCGNRICDKNENCLTCPEDCRCAHGYECIDGECVKEIFSIDLPDVRGMTWNISYTPNSDRIRISSSKCFYLDIFNAGGEEIDPYEADVKTCRSSVGDIYNTTGRDSTSWFNWNGCASTKYYEVEAGGELTLRVHTASCPSCVCHHPDFNIYEEIDGNWVKYVIDRTCTDSDGGMAIYVKENVLVLVAHNMIFVLLIALVVLLLWSIHVMVVYVSAISMIVQMAV